MTPKVRVIMLGAGGMAGRWVRTFVPLHRDRLEIVALVDVNEHVLNDTADFLGLPSTSRFSTMHSAFSRVDADCCFIVVPPAFHEEAVGHAVQRGLAILSEKPLADTWNACQRIYRTVRDAGIKMQVVQNYRYTATALTLRNVLQSGELGRVNYVFSRFASDYREPISWGAEYRYRVPHALLLEGATHHFDMLRNLSGSDCARIGGWEWNPRWSSSKGEFNCLYTLKMLNGVHAAYEGSATAAGEQNTWHEELYRVECEHGSASVGRDKVVRIHRFRRGSSMVIYELPPVKPVLPGHPIAVDQSHGAVIGQFLDWLSGGTAPESTLEDNIKSIAIVFAAIEASRSNTIVDVAAMIEDVSRETASEVPL